MENQEIINQEEVTPQEEAKTNQTTTEKLQALYEQMREEIKEYSEMVSELNSVEELEEKEKELIKLMEENDEYIKSVKYKLQDAVVFNGKFYTKSAVSKFINEQFDKLEVNWQMSLGIFQLYDFWKNTPDEIPYGTLDSTLRTLQQLKFKGYQDMRNILIINEYFKFNHEEYTKDLAKTSLLAEKHNTLIDRLKLISKTEDPAEAIAADELKDAMEKNNQ